MKTMICLRNYLDIQVGPNTDKLLEKSREVATLSSRIIVSFTFRNPPEFLSKTRSIKNAADPETQRKVSK